MLIGSIKNLINSYKVVASAVSRKPEPLKIMISGAPASGKGTQCELITGKVNLRFYNFSNFFFFFGFLYVISAICNNVRFYFYRIPCQVLRKIGGEDYETGNVMKDSSILLNTVDF